MTELPPIRYVFAVPGFHAASIFPVSRTLFRLTTRMSVILSRGAERNWGIRTTGGTDFRKLRRSMRGPPARDYQEMQQLVRPTPGLGKKPPLRSEEHTSELQSLRHLVCRLLLEKQQI